MSFYKQKSVCKKINIKFINISNCNLRVFVGTIEVNWCEDDAIAVLAVDKLHAERCARCNSSYFAKGEVIVTEVKMDKEKVILISNIRA